MKSRDALTLLELLVFIAVGALAVVVLVRVLASAREGSRWQRCRDNLDQLAKGMAAYLSDQGDRNYPCPLGRGAKGSGAETYNGAEWLAALYWIGLIRDPDIFLCPSSGDSNAKGKDLGCRAVNDIGGHFSSQTVSYAGLWWKSVTTATGGSVRDDFPPNEPMACDDTQGSINHGTATNGGMNILFFDGHVEFRTTPEVDVTSTLSGSVGRGFPNPPKTLLWRLRN